MDFTRDRAFFESLGRNLQHFKLQFKVFRIDLKTNVMSIVRFDSVDSMLEILQWTCSLL